eukprot:TRINITY_DN4340_c0_g1_i1.p1 TRINITY_DN4340_c0_g1~~TRINITY_DN4340_c0_g1_i1.p1  ORF type:complete len:58 (+),score=7.53 TRINITY_DN4340_c0_g1_i1:350-523(+)
MKETTIDTLLDMHTLCQEYMVEGLMKQQTETLGKRVHQISAIIDLTGLSTTQANMTA